jgi:3-hydroxyisobutyrate dehydrogenase
MKAGIIGLGAMGVGMAQNLLKQGYLTAAYNRSPDKLAGLDVKPVLPRKCWPGRLM